MSEPSTCLKPPLSDNSEWVAGGWQTAKCCLLITAWCGVGSGSRRLPPSNQAPSSFQYGNEAYLLTANENSFFIFFSAILFCTLLWYAKVYTLEATLKDFMHYSISQLKWNLKQMHDEQKCKAFLVTPGGRHFHETHHSFQENILTQSKEHLSKTYVNLMCIN